MYTFWFVQLQTMTDKGRLLTAGTNYIEVTSDKGHACINDSHKYQRLNLMTSVWSLVLAALIREMAAICQRI